MISTEIAELYALTQAYLLENFPSGSLLTASPETYRFFRSTSCGPTVKQAVEQKSSRPAASLSPPQITPSEPSPISNGAEPIQEKKKEISLSKIQKREAISHEDVLNAFKEEAPHLKILPLPSPEPSPVIALLHLGEPAAELRFLHHISQAISLCFGIRCKVMKPGLRPLDPSQTRLVLAAECRMNDSLKFENIPLFPLPDLSLHMNNPGLKASLWSTLCQYITRYVR